MQLRVTALFVLKTKIQGFFEEKKSSGADLIAQKSHCLRSEKKVHSDFDFFTFYLIKCVNLVLPGVDPGN